MNNSAKASPVDEINQLHGDAIKFSAQSSRHLQEAMAAAWRAGLLLRVEKKRVRRAMGRGAWPLWLEQNFSASPATARRYLHLADSVSDESLLGELSIRQMYLRNLAHNRSVCLHCLPIFDSLGVCSWPCKSVTSESKRPQDASLILRICARFIPNFACFLNQSMASNAFDPTLAGPIYL